MRVEPELIAAAILAELDRVHQDTYAGRLLDLFTAVKQRWPGEYSKEDFEKSLTMLMRVGGASRSQKLTEDFVRIDRSTAIKELRNPRDPRLSARRTLPLLWEYGQFGFEWLKNVWPPASSTAAEVAGAAANTAQRNDDLGTEEQLLPASDRLVPLDHNSAPYLEIKNGLAELHEELRSSNDLPCSPEERERLLASVSAAQRLWDAAQLKIIQIKVGIIITIQDAVSLLSQVGKGIGKALLIDTIKSIVKHKTGLDI